MVRPWAPFLSTAKTKPNTSERPRIILSLSDHFPAQAKSVSLLPTPSHRAFITSWPRLSMSHCMTVGVFLFSELQGARQGHPFFLLASLAFSAIPGSTNHSVLKSDPHIAVLFCWSSPPNPSFLRATHDPISPMIKNGSSLSVG